MSRVIRKKPSVLAFDVPGQYSGNDLRLQLPITVAELSEAQDHNYSYMAYIDEHFDFRSACEPWMWNERERLLSASEADFKFTNITFPGLQRRETILAMTAWFSYLCTIDDVVEAMEANAARQALLEAVTILKQPYGPLRNRSSFPDTPSSRVTHITYAFCRHLQALLAEQTYRNVSATICTVLGGIMAEMPFRAKGTSPETIDEYMAIRVRTIGIAPLAALLASENIDVSHTASSALRALEKEIFAIVGLQNDILGLEKDLRTGEMMNFVVVDSGIDLATADVLTEAGRGKVREGVAHLVLYHNERLQLAKRLRKVIASRPEDNGEREVAEGLYLLTATHFYWASAARRYRVTYSESSSSDSE